MVSRTGTSFSGASPLLLRPAVTVIRSWPEKEARANVRDGTARFAVSGDPTDTALIVMPSGKRTSSDPLQPVFWKSLMITTSRRLSGDRARMLFARFNDG